MGKLSARVERLEALADPPEPEFLELVWDRDREPEPGELVISWLREGLGDEPGPGPPGRVG